MVRARCQEDRLVDMCHTHPGSSGLKLILFLVYRVKRVSLLYDSSIRIIKIYFGSNLLLREEKISKMRVNDGIDDADDYHDVRSIMEIF